MFFLTNVILLKTKKYVTFNMVFRAARARLSAPPPSAATAVPPLENRSRRGDVGERVSSEPMRGRGEAKGEHEARTPHRL